MCYLLDELWSLIFREYLDLVDLVRMREVCKRFKFLVDQLGLSEVLVFNYPIRFLNVLKVDKVPYLWIRSRGFELELNCPKFIAFRTLFANLKHLQLGIALGRDGLNLEVLNEFTKLEKLHVEEMRIKRDLVLRLPKLRTLSIRLQSEREYILRPHEVKRLNYDREPHLVVDSRVETLICKRLNLIRLKHPECIEFLESEIANRDNIGSFQNLRVLHTVITESILANFQILNHLQEIHLSWNKCKMMPDVAGELVRMIDQLSGKNCELKKNVKIYFLNFPLTRPLKELFLDLLEYRTISGFFLLDLLAARIRQYHNLIGPVPCVESVDYLPLIRCLDAERANFLRNQVMLDDQQFPMDFFLKFQDIRKVYVAEAPVDEERFLFFLGQCPKLVQLFFEEDSLSQPVLNRLPIACKKLQVLFIRGFGSRTYRLDFSPVYKLKELFTLEILTRLKLENPLNFIRLLEECRFLSNITLVTFDIGRKEGPKSFFFHWKKDVHFELENLSYEQLKATLREFV